MTTELPGLDDGDPFDPEQARRLESLEYEHIVDADEALKRFIERRKSAYAAVFGDKNDPNVQFVIEDLAYFSRAFHPPYDPDARKQDVKIGRVEMFWRIYEHTHLPVETLFLRYTDALLKLQQNGNPNG